MRLVQTIMLCLFCHAAAAQTYINPEGWYDLVAKTRKDKNGDIYGSLGSLQVKCLGNDKIVVVIDGNRGAPSYNMGMLHDTAMYFHNTVVCTTNEDSTCRITIKFSKHSAAVVHDAADLNFSCGFGHAVDLTGTYKKKKGKLITLMDPTTGLEIK